MQKLSELDTEDLSNFCGQCHRSWSQIAMAGPRGILNVRFQPYRLGNNKCYDTEDRHAFAVSRATTPASRLGDFGIRLRWEVPGLPLEGGETRRQGLRSLSVIVSSKDCVTCHIPKLDVSRSP